MIADCIETCANAQWLDGLIVIGGCDKNMPGGMMGIARLTYRQYTFMGEQ